MRCWKPSTIPTTSQPELMASIVAAEITELMPGAGPPPPRIPILNRLLLIGPFWFTSEQAILGPAPAPSVARLSCADPLFRPGGLKGLLRWADPTCTAPFSWECGVRRISTVVLCVALGVSAALVAPGAFADSVQQRLDQARAEKAQAEATVRKAEARLAVLRKQYLAMEGRLEIAARDALDAYVAQLSLSAQLAQAPQTLNRQAAEGYAIGPGLGL